MKNFIILTTILTTGSIHSSLITSSASKFLANAAYHTNDFHGAQKKYTNLLESNPYDPETNYNLGLTFLKQMKHDQALSYFTRASKRAKPNSKLQEQSLFNQGNTLVGLNKLQESLKSYEQVLAINKANDRARHNIEVVKKMLEQQNQQKNDKNDENKDNDKNENKDQKSDNKSSKDSASKDQKSDNNDSKDSDSTDNNSEKLDDKKDQEKTKQEKDQEEKKDKNRDQKEQSSNKDQTKEQSADQLEKSKQQKEKQDESLKKSKEKQNNSNESGQIDQQDSQEESLKDELAEIVDPADKDERLEKSSANLMQKMKEHEDHIQKQLLKMNVSKNGAAKHGQKNW